LLKIIIVLWGTIIVFLALSDIFINHYEWVDSDPIQRLVNITRDDGLPNWFSSIQLLAVSVILWMILFSLLYSRPYLIIKKTEKLGWGLSALFFTYLAIDDGSKMHERIGGAFRNSIEARHLHSPTIISKIFDVFPSYGWQFVFVPIFGLIAIFMLLFLFKNLKTKKQIILVILGFSCYVASVVLDFVEGMNEKVYDEVVSFFGTNLHSVQHFSKLIEEVFEMVGNTFFMLAFTKQLMNLAQNWKIQFIDLINKEDRIK
jgi:hypothetical protein